MGRAGRHTRPGGGGEHEQQGHPVQGSARRELAGRVLPDHHGYYGAGVSTWLLSPFPFCSRADDQCSGSRAESQACEPYLLYLLRAAASYFRLFPAQFIFSEPWALHSPWVCERCARFRGLLSCIAELASFILFISARGAFLIREIASVAGPILALVVSHELAAFAAAFSSYLCFESSLSLQAVSLACLIFSSRLSLSSPLNDSTLDC